MKTSIECDYQNTRSAFASLGLLALVLFVAVVAIDYLSPGSSLRLAHAADGLEAGTLKGMLSVTQPKRPALSRSAEASPEPNSQINACDQIENKFDRGSCEQRERITQRHREVAERRARTETVDNNESITRHGAGTPQ